MQVFRITPKRLMCVNGQVLSPEMLVTEFLPFTTVRCPNCGKKVLFWTGFKQVVKNR